MRLRSLTDAKASFSVTTPRFNDLHNKVRAATSSGPMVGAFLGWLVTTLLATST